MASALDSATPARTEAIRAGAPGVAGLGTALPTRVVTSAEVAETSGVDADWILRRTGIRTRRHAEPGARLSELAAEAGRRALEDAGVAPASLDLVVVATFTPDTVLPAEAPRVAHALGATNAAAFDLGAACAGFVYAISVAGALIEHGPMRHALVIGAEIVSRHLDPGDRRTAPLFGDGAGAVVLSAGAAGAIGPVVLGCDGAAADLIRTSPDTGKMQMDGHETFVQAVRRLGEAVDEACARAGVGVAGVDLFVFHQANARITASLVERLGVEPERVIDCIAELGNTSAASVPLALEHARREDRLRPGMKVVLAAVGAGFVWGAAVIDWEAA